jgi:hypothetical protein
MTRERRQEIIAFRKKKDWSFQLIADYFGVTRNQVAGIMFRHNHRDNKLVCSPRSAGANKTGTGHQGPGAMPRYNALNYEVRT